MRRNPIFFIAIITFGLTLLIAYQIMVQGKFPWLLLFALFLVTLLGLYAFGPTIFPRTSITGPSPFVKFQLESLKVTPFALVVIILYDYWVRHILRWEVYAGLVATQLLLLLIGFLLSRRTA